MVFQHFHLFPHLSVLANIVLAPRVVRRRPAGEVEGEARALLARVGLADKAAAVPPAALRRGTAAGGDRAGARDASQGPPLRRADLGARPEMIREVLDVMRDLARGGMTMVVATHEMGFAREVAQEVLFLDRGEADRAGPPDAISSIARASPDRRIPLEDPLTRGVPGRTCERPRPAGDEVFRLGNSIRNAELAVVALDLSPGRVLGRDDLALGAVTGRAVALRMTALSAAVGSHQHLAAAVVEAASLGRRAGDRSNRPSTDHRCRCRRSRG